MRTSILILMPFYNEERFIEKALSSVLNQTFIDWKLIGSNNGSNDSSGDIFQTFVDRDSRFILLSNVTNLSGDLNWNSLADFALSNISSDFILWLAGDDSFADSSYLDNLFNTACSSGYQVIAPKVVLVSEKDITQSIYEFDLDHALLYRLIKFALGWHHVNLIYAFYRREVFEKLINSSCSRFTNSETTDWWWTFELIRKNRIITESKSTYLKVIKDQILEPKPSKPFLLRLLRFIFRNSANGQFFRIIRHHGFRLNFRNFFPFLTIIFFRFCLSPYLDIRYLQSYLKRISDLEGR